MIRKTKLLLFSVFCLLTIGFSCADPNEDNFKTMKSFMDFEANPCDNFYKYACANFEKVDNSSLKNYQDPIEALNYNWNRIRVFTIKNLKPKNEIYKKLKDFYDTCSAWDTKLLSNIKSYADMFRSVEPEFGWMEKLYAPSFDEPDSTWKWTETLGKLRRYGINDFLIEQEFHRVDVKTFNVYLSMPFWNFERSDRFRYFIHRWISSDATKAFGEQVEKFADDLDNCYKTHAKDANPGFMTLKELSVETPAIDFKSYLEAVFNETFKDDEKIYVDNLECFKGLNKILANTPKSVIAALMAITAESYLHEKDQQRIESDYHCAEVLWNYVPFAVNYVMYQEHHKESKQAIQTVVERIFDILRAKAMHVLDVHKSDFEDPYYYAMKDKINAMRVNVGNLPNNVDDNFISDYYKDWNVTKDSVIDNFLHLYHFKYTRENFLLRNPYSAVEYWLSSHNTSVPKLSWHTNVVTVPFGYFVEPFFNVGYKDVYLFSTLGNSLMNQFMHGFTPKGQMYDANGVLSDTFKTFPNNTLYKAILGLLHSLPPEYDVNDKQADYLGLHYTYEAYFHQKDLKEETYQSDLNDRKVFFIKYAQFYCSFNYDEPEPVTKPTSYNRLNQLLLRTSGLKEAFNCPPVKEVYNLW